MDFKIHKTINDDFINNLFCFISVDYQQDCIYAISKAIYCYQQFVSFTYGNNPLGFSYFDNILIIQQTNEKNI